MASGNIVVPPIPPKAYGTLGAPISLLTNFYPLKVVSKEFFQYVVQIEPPAEARFLRTKILRALEALPTFGAYIFDGQLLFSQRKFMEVHETIQIEEHTYQVAVKFTNTLALGTLPPSAAQLINILLRKCHRIMLLRPIGRNYFDPSRKVKLEQYKMEIWPGIFSSTMAIDGGVALNVDSCSKVVRDQTALEFIDLIRRRDVHHLKSLEEACNDQMQRAIVMTAYNNRTYRIERIDTSRSPATMFEANGKQKSLLEYYKARYGITIRDTKQPLIIAQQKPRPGEATNELLLIPELCCMTGLTEDMRSDFQTMKEVGNVTRVGPTEKLEIIQKYRRRLDEPECKTVLAQWDLQVGAEPMKIQGRVLEPETIYLKKKSEKAHKDRADWSNLMRSEELISTVDLKAEKWMIIVSNRDRELAQMFLSTLRSVAAPLKVKIGEPMMHYLPNDRTETYEKLLNDELKPDFQLVVFIIPPKGKERYDRLKQLLLLKMPLPSQAIQTKTLAKEKMLQAVCIKICQQIQAKLAAELWRLDIPLKNSMMVGMDVYHDTVTKGTSVLAFCASYNENFTKYWSTVAFQKSGQEICDKLSTCMQGALKEYQAKNKGQLPEKIFVFRDGVGSGQLDAVRKIEIKHLLELFAQIPNYKPKMAFLIVTKRINTRFFTLAKQNPPPGLIVDRTVSSQSHYDFFLVAQSVNQGTATPTHYLVLMDTTGLKPDHLQSLTYKLCHLYYNWPGTVRVPAPCQYAHKLAFLIGQSVHRAPHARLASNLYFL